MLPGLLHLLRHVLLLLLLLLLLRAGTGRGLLLSPLLLLGLGLGLRLWLGPPSLLLLRLGLETGCRLLLGLVVCCRLLLLGSVGALQRGRRRLASPQQGGEARTGHPTEPRAGAPDALQKPHDGRPGPLQTLEPGGSVRCRRIASNPGPSWEVSGVIAHKLAPSPETKPGGGGGRGRCHLTLAESAATLQTLEEARGVTCAPGVWCNQ